MTERRELTNFPFARLSKRSRGRVRLYFSHRMARWLMHTTVALACQAFRSLARLGGHTITLVERSWWCISRQACAVLPDNKQKHINSLRASSCLWTASRSTILSFPAPQSNCCDLSLPPLTSVSQCPQCWTLLSDCWRSLVVIVAIAGCNPSPQLQAITHTHPLPHSLTASSPSITHFTPLHPPPNSLPPSPLPHFSHPLHYGSLHLHIRPILTTAALSVLRPPTAIISPRPLRLCCRCVLHRRRERLHYPPGRHRVRLVRLVARLHHTARSLA